MTTKVFIIESEKGWGQKVEEVKEFPTPEEAERFCREYNSKHNPWTPEAPAWYMYARLEGQEDVGMLRLFDFGCHADKPRLPVKHAALERFGDSPYKSLCPSCKTGLLLVLRDRRSLVLQENDTCTYCQQKFNYLDIVAMRAAEGHQ